MRTFRDGKVLFISRGLGWGHSTRDMLIAKLIKEISPEVKIEFASCDAGYRAYNTLGYECFDLDLPANGAVGKRILKIGRLIKENQPALAIVDEELLALPIAKLFDVPVIFITNWFPLRRDREGIGLFNQADAILFTEYESFFKKPRGISVPVECAGPVYRTFPHRQEEKLKIRKELGINTRYLILTTIGGGAAKAISYDTALLECIVDAFLKLDMDAQLWLICGALDKFFKYAEAKGGNIKILGSTSELPKFMFASDLVITRSGVTLWELAGLGIPSICIPAPSSVNIYAQHYARVMATRGTTISILQEDINPEKLKVLIQYTLKPENYNKLKGACLKFSKENRNKRAARYIVNFYNGLF